MLTTITCPECGYVAAVLDRFQLASTDGPVEHLRTGCVNGHYFAMPAEAYTTCTTSSTAGHPVRSG